MKVFLGQLSPEGVVSLPDSLENMALVFGEDEHSKALLKALQEARLPNLKHLSELFDRYCFMHSPSSSPAEPLQCCDVQLSQMTASHCSGYRLVISNKIFIYLSIDLLIYLLFFSFCTKVDESFYLKLSVILIRALRTDPDQMIICSSRSLPHPIISCGALKIQSRLKEHRGSIDTITSQIETVKTMDLFNQAVILLEVPSLNRKCVK